MKTTKLNIQIPQRLPLPRRIPDVANCQPYIRFLKRINEVKFASDRAETIKLAKDALEAASRFALVVERLNDLGASCETNDDEIYSALLELYSAYVTA